jgi:hypothetical protein
MFGTYLRLHVPVHADWRAVIRAAASMLAPHARRDPAKREARRDFYRKMIEHHIATQGLIHAARL